LIDVIGLHFSNVAFGEIKTLMKMFPVDKTALRSLRTNLSAILLSAIAADNHLGHHGPVTMWEHHEERCLKAEIRMTAVPKYRH
jgi:hypothetical protein